MANRQVNKVNKFDYSTNNNVTEAVARANMPEKVTVTKRKDIGYFREMGVAVTPALVIDGRVVYKGKVLAEDRIFGILRKEQA
jgi:hypothetical protein